VSIVASVDCRSHWPQSLRIRKLSNQDLQAATRPTKSWYVCLRKLGDACRQAAVNCGKSVSPKIANSTETTPHSLQPSACLSRTQMVGKDQRIATAHAAVHSGIADGMGCALGDRACQPPIKERDESTVVAHKSLSTPACLMPQGRYGRRARGAMPAPDIPAHVGGPDGAIKASPRKAQAIGYFCRAKILQGW